VSVLANLQNRCNKTNTNVETPPFTKLPIKDLHNIATKKPKKSNKTNRAWSCFEVELDYNCKVSKCKRRLTNIGLN
jgi:hypothetical protein